MWRFKAFAVVLVLSSCITAAQSHNRLFDGLSEFSNVCTNGKSASKLSIKAYMTEFAAGPCSPLIMLPGIMGSVLNIQIDCHKLKAADPETFQNCGWSTCPGEVRYTPEDSPNKEYQGWMPGLFSPMSLATPNEKAKLCFGGLIQVVYDKSSGKMIYKDKPGVTIKPKGFTSETLDYIGSECGSTGVQDLIQGTVVPEAAKYFRNIIDRLKQMGYRSGLTLQALPYDFRLNSGVDPVSKNLDKVIKRLKNFNNKKVIILTHSMGGTKAIYSLWNMNQEDKDENIALFIPMAPPFIGAGKPIQFLTCGTNQYFKVFAGLDMQTFKKSAGTFPSILEMAPSMLYSREADQLWMKKVKERIAYENNESDDPVFDWLPTREQVCYQQYSQKTCRSGLQTFDNFGTYLKDTPITVDSYRAWINEYGFNQNAKDIWHTLDSRFDTMPNPGVPTVVMYSQVLDTPGIYSFNIDPRKASSVNRVCSKEEMTYTPFRGDTTVPATSSVTPAIKWALEFMNKEKNAKPVKIVDICSQINVKSSPYDGDTENDRKSINKVEYQGLVCDCTEDKERHCNHESILVLPQLVDFVANSVISNDRSTVSHEVAAMSEELLVDFQQTCQIQLLLLSSNPKGDVNSKKNSEKVLVDN